MGSEMHKYSLSPSASYSGKCLLKFYMFNDDWFSSEVPYWEHAFAWNAPELT